MLSYLSKFILQMLPTISATVIGAYIVATWVNPRTPTETAKIAAGASRQQAAKVAYPVAEPAPEAQPAESRAVEAAAAKTAPETIRIIPIVKQSAPSQDAAASTPASPPVVETTAAADERRDANTLARAAILRQRSGPEASRAADEPAKPATPAARSQGGRSAPDVQPAMATIAPPLPPAVTITPLRSPQEVADERPNPPAEIPSTRNPLSLQASHRVAENPSPADEFLNATRSFFRALTPQ